MGTALKSAQTKAREKYIERASECIKLMDDGVSKLMENIDSPDAIWGMLEQCHYLERISLDSEQYLIAYLASKISSLLIHIATATPAEGKRHLIFLKDLFGSLKRALDYAAKKRKYYIRTEKFDKFDKLTRAYLRWKKVV
jgi:hypothetical protein